MVSPMLPITLMPIMPITIQITHQAPAGKGFFAGGEGEFMKLITSIGHFYFIETSNCNLKIIHRFAKYHAK